MQTGTPRKPTNKITLVAGGIGLGILLCCCAVFGARLLAPASTPRPAVTPTSGNPGATVVFVDATKPAKPTASTLGLTRDNPYPANTTVDIGGDRLLSVVFVTRPADEIIRNANRFYSTPTPDEEYILVDVRVECTKGANEKCSFSSYDLKAVGLDGMVHDRENMSQIPNPLESHIEFFGGSAIDGSLVFLVTRGDASTVLFYEPLLFGDPIYISLE